MKLQVESAGTDFTDVWDVSTIEELLEKVNECGHDIVLSAAGEVIIYDSYLE